MEPVIEPAVAEFDVPFGVDLMTDVTIVALASRTPTWTTDDVGVRRDDT